MRVAGGIANLECRPVEPRLGSPASSVFVESACKYGATPSAAKDRKTNPIGRAVLMFRNLACGLCALFLIVSGRAHRARRRAFNGEVITSIYFHRPNRKLFAQCISWLAKHGYTFISSDELIKILHNGGPFPRGGAWISLDDGYRSWLVDVLPVIRQYKVPVTLFVPSGIVSGNGLFPFFHDPRYPRETRKFIQSVPKKEVIREALTIEELKRIAAYPEVEIGGHTVSHAITVYSTQQDLQFEIGEDKRAIEAWTGASVKSFAYPAGYVDGRETQFLQDFGFAVAATTEPSFITRRTDPLRVPRFCVPDNVTFPEAICAMVGVWRPFIDPIKRLFGDAGGLAPSPANGRNYQ